MIILASPISSNVVQLSQARTSMVVMEGLAVNMLKVGFVDDELPTVHRKVHRCSRQSKLCWQGR